MSLGSGELGGETFSVAAVAYGRMPRSTFVTGDRIPALVDHRVVAMTSLSYVSLHDVLLQPAVSTIRTRRNSRWTKPTQLGIAQPMTNVLVMDLGSEVSVPGEDPDD